MFSPTVMEHFLEPRNVGELDLPFGEGCSGSVDSGRFIRMQVRLSCGRVQAVRFRTYGCAPAIAAGSLLSEWATGRPVDQALALSPGDLDRLLGGLPEERRFCAELGIAAFRRAVAAAQGPGGEPV